MIVFFPTLNCDQEINGFALHENKNRGEKEEDVGIFAIIRIVLSTNKSQTSTSNTFYSTIASSHRAYCALCLCFVLVCLPLCRCEYVVVFVKSHRHHSVYCLLESISSISKHTTRVTPISAIRRQYTIPLCKCLFTVYLFFFFPTNKRIGSERKRAIENNSLSRTDMNCLWLLNRIYI